MQLVFAAHPGWSGKEVQAHRINFHVNGLLPLTSGTWSRRRLQRRMRPEMEISAPRLLPSIRC
jgi:hypothetical protein